MRINSFLKDNKALILTAWRMNLEANPASGALRKEAIYRELLDGAFYEILVLLHHRPGHPTVRRSLHRYFNDLMSCTPHRKSCVELYREGLAAFFTVIETPGFSRKVFRRKEISEFKPELERAFRIFIHREINVCCVECSQPGCPFAAGSIERFPVTDQSDGEGDEEEEGDRQ